MRNPKRKWNFMNIIRNALWANQNDFKRKYQTVCYIHKCVNDNDIHKKKYEAHPFQQCKNVEWTSRREWDKALGRSTFGLQFTYRKMCVLTYHSFTQKCFEYIMYSTICMYFFYRLLCYTLTIIRIQSCWFSLSLSFLLNLLNAFSTPLSLWLFLSDLMAFMRKSRFSEYWTLQSLECSCIRQVHYSRTF